jgi:acetyl esterase/lipase
MMTSAPRRAGLVFALAVVADAAVVLRGQTGGPPVSQTYKTVGSTALAAHVFAAAQGRSPRPAAVLFHGGGWAAGSPEWSFGSACEYAERGIVGVAIQYRLSDRKAITPVEAVEDAMDAIRWVRAHATTLGIDPQRVIAHGVSAGGQLAAIAAEKGDAAARPNLLVLWSPGIAVGSDPYFRRLVGDRANPDDLSPDLQVRSGLPPTIIISGVEDIVTPDAEAKRFCAAITKGRGRCDVHSYPGVGHLLTRKLDPNAQFGGQFDFDPTTTADANNRIWAFLREHGVIDR